MTKLTETQTLILSRASQQDDRIALPLPDRLRGGAANKVIVPLIQKGFLDEVEADIRKGEPTWRKTGDGHGITLVITGAGLEAIGVETERRDVFDYIEMFYNPKRKHARNGMLPPVEFERQQKVNREGV